MGAAVNVTGGSVLAFFLAWTTERVLADAPRAGPLWPRRRERGIAGGTVLRAVAGFTAKGDVETTSLVERVRAL